MELKSEIKIGNITYKCAPEIIRDSYKYFGLFIIYRAVLKKDGREYFGQTCQTLNVRKSMHKCSSKYKKYRKHYFHKAINSYGINEFSWEIWDYDYGLDNILIKEKYWIKKHQTNAFSKDYIGKGFNSTDGGEKSHFVGKGFKKSDETRKKISIANTGKNPSSEARERMSKAQLGRKHSPETIEKMKISQKGKYVSPETCAKLKICNPHNKTVINILTGVFYRSISDASRKTGIHTTTIRQHCHNRVKKYKWRFATEEEIKNVDLFKN